MEIKNGKSTALGILTIVGAVVSTMKTFLAGMPVDWNATLLAIGGGWAMIMMREQGQHEKDKESGNT